MPLQYLNPWQEIQVAVYTYYSSGCKLNGNLEISQGGHWGGTEPLISTLTVHHASHWTIMHPSYPSFHKRLYTRGPRHNSSCYAAAKMMRKLATFPVCNRGADKKTKSLTFHSTTVVSFQTLPPTPQSSHPLIPLPTVNKITSASRHIYLNLTMLTGRRRKEDIVIH